MPAPRRLMKDYTARPIELDSTMLAYLEEVAKKYSLADAGKAVRCLVNYARENPDRGDEIFDEIRCQGC
jgi:hypothetical protein